MLLLTPTPLANSFPDKPDAGAQRFPNEIEECILCGHVQQSFEAEIDWEDYRYRTPEANRPRLAAMAEELRLRYPGMKTVLEIGCNNGIYLEELRRVGFQALGVDPNASVGIKEPFSYDLAKKLGVVDIIVANNVLAHVDDLWDVFRGIDAMLDDGVLIFEVQDIGAMLKSGAFDMMYHEHRDYHDLYSLVPFLRRWGLEITDEEYLTVHGGSKRYTCRRPQRWRSFRDRIQCEKENLLAHLHTVDGTIACFGATAKACTLIHHFGLAEKITYCVDDTPEKQGRFIPGTNICIYPTSHLEMAPPKAVIMTAWNFKDVLLEKYPHLPWIIPFEEAVCR